MGRSVSGGQTGLFISASEMSSYSPATMSLRLQFSYFLQHLIFSTPLLCIYSGYFFSLMYPSLVHSQRFFFPPVKSSQALFFSIFSLSVSLHLSHTHTHSMERKGGGRKEGTHPCLHTHAHITEHKTECCSGHFSTCNQLGICPLLFSTLLQLGLST